jgi:hypothetical protein
MHGSYVQVYKGKYFSKPKFKQVSKVIAFDLDETLGSFIDLDILWRTLKNLEKQYDIIVDFNKLLDLYPEFLRYGILSILEFLYQKKKAKQCNKIYIYTNNQCSQDWSSMISDYFDYKLKTEEKLFDKIIYAFKINNKHIELSRTTHNKTYNDFIRCTLLPKTTEICFLDNSEFNEMKDEHVYYIQPTSYYHDLSIDEIVSRFVKSDIGELFIKKMNPKELYEKIHTNFVGLDSYRHMNKKIDIQVSQKIMYHLKEFFFLTNKKLRTKKIRYNLGRTTRKKHT